MTMLMIISCPSNAGLPDPNELSPKSTEGPDQNSNVMCLTCHRAHASPFAHDGRWDFQSTLLAEAPIFDFPEGANAYYGETIDCPVWTLPALALQQMSCEGLKREHASGHSGGLA